MKKDQNQKLDIPEISLSDNELPEEEEQQKSSFLRKIFKKKDAQVPVLPPPKIRRCNPKADEGLSTKQVNERIHMACIRT